MDRKNILLVAFRGTSAQRLLEQRDHWKKLLLPNHRIKDSAMLMDALSKEQFDYVFCFGQKPLIKNKICIETTAREGVKEINTDFDCEKMRDLFDQIGIFAKISHNAGTSFCNRLYYNGLKYVAQNKLETQIVFLHIPFSANITDDKSFCNKVFRVLEMYSIF